MEKSGERYADGNVHEYGRYGGGSVMVWAGICLDGRTDLHVVDRGALTAVRYRDKVLHPMARPFTGAVGPEFILMQDARPHNARAAMKYLYQEGIPGKGSMLWSGQLDPRTYIQLNICGICPILPGQSLVAPT